MQMHCTKIGNWACNIVILVKSCANSILKSKAFVIHDRMQISICIYSWQRYLHLNPKHIYTAMERMQYQMEQCHDLVFFSSIMLVFSLISSFFQWKYYGEWHSNEIFVWSIYTNHSMCSQYTKFKSLCWWRDEEDEENKFLSDIVQIYSKYAYSIVTIFVFLLDLFVHEFDY